MNISPQKMTFLTANYGLSPEQIYTFWRAYNTVYQQQSGEIEYTWEEGGWMPENPDQAMIECLTDADRLEPYIHDYVNWCFDFRFKQELVHDLEDRHMPRHLQDYLESQGKTSWRAVNWMMTHIR